LTKEEGDYFSYLLGDVHSKYLPHKKIKAKHAKKNTWDIPVDLIV
jgi:hypothetical protein